MRQALDTAMTAPSSRTWTAFQIDTLLKSGGLHATRYSGAQLRRGAAICWFRLLY